MENNTVHILALIIFIVVIVCGYFIARSFYRFSLRMKAESSAISKQKVKRIIEQDKEIIQRYLEIKNSYCKSLDNLRNDPTNIDLKRYTLEAGQKLIQFTRSHAVSDERFVLFDETALMNDVPQRTDKLYVDALRICLDSAHVNTYVLPRQLGTNRETAEAILDAMAQEGFVGEQDPLTRLRPLLNSSVNRLLRRIDDANEKEKKEKEAFQFELLRLKKSAEYKYVYQFAQKYDRNWCASEFVKLQNLLSSKGFEFSDDQVNEIVDLELNEKSYRDAKSKILDGEPKEVQDIFEAYLNFFQADDATMFEVLKEIIEEKSLFGLFSNNPEELRREVKKIEKEIELKIFESRLLEEHKHVRIEDVDRLDGYEFERFLTNLFSKMGYQVEQTKLSGDQGADLVVTKLGEKLIIQAKRFGGKVGNKAVQEIMAAISLYKAHQGLVVTNNYFTSSAFELANANHIKLIDRDALEELINKHW